MSESSVVLEQRRQQITSLLFMGARVSLGSVASHCMPSLSHPRCGNAWNTSNTIGSSRW